MKIYKTKKFNNKFLSWNGVKQKTGLDDETITSLWLCGEFPDCLPCSTFALGDGRRSEGVWLCFEINSWINAWGKGLRGDVLRELVAELKAARNAPIASLFPDNAAPIDVLKLLFPECASVIDLEMKDFKKPFQDIYSVFGKPPVPEEALLLLSSYSLSGLNPFHLFMAAFTSFSMIMLMASAACSIASMTSAVSSLSKCPRTQSARSILGGFFPTPTLTLAN